MNAENVQRMIDEALLRERWRLASQLAKFNIDQNPLPETQYSDPYSTQYPIENWDSAVASLVNEVRRLACPKCIHVVAEDLDAMTLKFCCSQCRTFFFANLLTRENIIIDDKGYFIPACPSKKCQKAKG